MSDKRSTGVATKVKVVQPGGGRAGGLAPGIGVVFKIDGEDSGSALSIVEHPFEVHAMWNAGSVPARMIEVISPAGFENFFRELVDITDKGPPDPSAMPPLGQKYGLPFADPDWLPDVIERYNLTPPPGP